MWFLSFFLTLALAPLLPGIINKVKAFFAGRWGPPVLQLYFDIIKLLRKASIYSTTTTALVRITPTISLATLLVAAAFMPFGTIASPLAFQGDAVLFFYLLAAGRLAIVLGALDTGSAFEGMGASREVQFSALAETVVFAILGFLAMLSGDLSLSGSLNGFDASAWTVSGTSMLLTAVACFVVVLVENCRIPFDDPETHLELTMIHEAMILDHAGPDLAFLHYAAALKLWVLVSFLALLILPLGPTASILRIFIHVGTVLLIGVIVGIIESVLARFRFLKVPHLLVGSLALSLIAILFLHFFRT